MRPTRPALRAVFLDAGGTLLHEDPPRHAIYAEAARRRGLAVDDARMKAAMWRAHERLPRELGPHFRYSRGWFEAFIEDVFVAQLGLAPSALADVRRELFARFEDAATFRLFPGAAASIAALRAAGLKVGVVSNWSEALPGVLAGLGLARELDFLLVSAVERCEKPEPAIFRRALELAGANPDEAAHVGDDLERDVRGAQALGILTVWVDRRSAADPRPPSHLARPDLTVTGLNELERCLRERATT